MKIILAINLIRYSSIFFLVGLLVSMYFYPGGNIHDSSQIGYSFINNFLSDLGGYKSHSGEVNFLSSTFFALSLSIFSLAGLAFLVIPEIFKDDNLNYILYLIGAILFFVGSIFFAAVGFTPYDLYFDEHVFFAKNSFRLMIPASLFLLLVLGRSGVSKNYLINKPKGVRGRTSDNRLIREKIGWDTQINLKEGLKRTYKWIYDQSISGSNISKFTKSNI